MGKPVLLGTLGVVVGTIAGMFIMMGLHMASTVVYPPPKASTSWTSPRKG